MVVPKPIVWSRGEIKTPPFSREARLEAVSCFADCKMANCSGCRPLVRLRVVRED